jgi:predicted nucleic acid-binding protein
LLEVFVGDADLLTAEDALAEFERVLAYEHLPFTATEQKRFPALLRREATVIEPDRSVHTVEDDPDDDLFLQCTTSSTPRAVASRRTESSRDRELADCDGPKPDFEPNCR